MQPAIRHALYVTAAAALLGLAAAPAHARGEVYFSIGVQPAPVYVQPAPVYVQPRPVYVQPQYGYVTPVRPYYHASHGWDRHDWDRRDWRARRFGPNGDLDRDGIRNRDDRDRDGDGIRNRRDRLPNDPYRY